MNNKALKRHKRKIDKQRRQRARARIPHFKMSVRMGTPTPKFRDAVFEATRVAAKSAEGIELMERHNQGRLPEGVAEMQLTLMAYNHLPACGYKADVPVEQGNIAYLDDRDAVFIFRRMRRMQQGWYSPHKPTIEFAGHKRMIVWSRHACRRVLERTTRRENAGEDWHHAFTPLYGIRRWECYPSGIKVWMPCYPGTLQWDLARHIVRQSELPEDSHVLVGYGVVEPLGDRLALVKTLLSPGYVNTPEWDYLRRSSAGLPLFAVKQEMSELMTMQGAMDRGGCDVLRELHENGYPQVTSLKNSVDYFPPELLEDGNRLLRRVDIRRKVASAIWAQRTGR